MVVVTIVKDIIPVEVLPAVTLVTNDVRIVLDREDLNVSDDGAGTVYIS